VSRARWAGRALKAAPLLFALINLHAETKTIWQIGKFDQSPVEFLGSPNGPIHYHVGESDWKKDWPKSQSVGQPYQVLFDLESPRGVYSLKISLLVERPRIPNMRVEINGHTGTFYLHPQLSYSRSDFTYAFDPHESQSQLLIDLPPAYLKSGQNIIAITAVDDPVSSAEERNESGITYDALALEQDSDRKFNPSEITAEAFPTIFYRQNVSGLVEIVEAFIRLNRPAKSGFAQLEIGGQKYGAKLDGSQDFGERRLSFEVPAWTGAAPAKLNVKAEGRKTFALSLTAERRWTVFVVPHTHLDIGYSDFQGKVAEIQSRVLSQAGALVKQYPDFRFSMDGSWILEQFLNSRAKPKQDELVGLIRDGKMAMPAQYVNLLTGYASLETLYRSLYESKRLSKRYGLPYE
jgi:alpha-mannosidase